LAKVELKEPFPISGTRPALKAGFFGSVFMAAFVQGLEREQEHLP